MIAKLLVGVALFVTMAAIGFGIWYSRDRSAYAPGYSEEKFSSVKIGMGESEARELLGLPLVESEDAFPETWYFDEVKPTKLFPTFRLADRRKAVVFDAGGHVVEVRGIESTEARQAKSKDEIRHVLGEPSAVIHERARCAHYSSPPAFGRFSARILAISREGRVAQVFAYDTYD